MTPLCRRCDRWCAKVARIERQIRRLRTKLDAGEAGPDDEAALMAALDRLEELVADDAKRGAKRLMAELARVQITLLKRLAAMNAAATKGHPS